jgi:hypothetical protein
MEGSHRLVSLTPEHLDQPDLAVQDSSCAVGEIWAHESGPAQVQGMLAFALLKEDVGETPLDPRQEIARLRAFPSSLEKAAG